MSKIAIIGATGRAGSQLLEEAIRRGHTVTAIARNTSTIGTRTGVTAKNIDAMNTAAIQEAITGHDAVISATHFSGMPANAVIDPVKKAGVKRLLKVGGAASLFAAPGLKVFDTPNFPAEYKEEASQGMAFLNILLEEKELDWTFVSPSAEIVETECTGTFRIGKDDLLVDTNGRSWISFKDFAIAMIDELENPTHTRERFTVGY